MASIMTLDLLRISLSGGSLRIDASEKMTSDLIRIAMSMKGHNNQLCLYNCNSKSTNDLIRISSANPGHVVFEF